MSSVTGATEAAAAIRAMAGRLEAATPEALGTAVALFEGHAKAKLSQTSHARGTPTPSRPGQPPSLINGFLRGSFEIEDPITAGGDFSVSVGPTTVYAAIQETGGWAGRGHRSYLPPRPYVAPALKDLLASGDIEGVFARAWQAALSA